MNPGEPLPADHLLDGRYRIHKILGQGGMGRVYLANDTRLANRPVAAKEMVLGDGIAEKKAVDDFNREASVLATLSHPSIPQVIDFFAERGRHYLVMEFVAGADLQQRLDELGPGVHIGEGQVVNWARQMLDILQFLHSQKPPLVYRDLKPGNIMIDHQGRAMLIDFGIARFLPPGGRGTQIGSVGYAPPEQYLGKMEPRSDLYALAATMHHLLTGRDPQLEPPFSFPPVRSLAPEVSLATEAVVMSALDREIEKRPASARAMRDRLPASDSAQMVTGDRVPGDVRARPDQKKSEQMPMIVLDRPVGPSGIAKTPSLSKPKNKANAQTQRSLSLEIKPLSPPSKVEAAATAKTRDLGTRIATVPSPSSSPSSTAAAKSSVRSGLAAAVSSMRAAVAAPIKPAPTVKATGLPTRVAEPAGKTAAGNGDSLARPAAAPTPLASLASAAARLVANGDGRQFGLTGPRLVIGRVESASDVIDIDLSVIRRGADRISRRHAEIIRQGVDYFIRDLGSLNGTYITGRGRLGRDQLYRLRDRDELVIGGAKLEFRKG